MHNIKKIYLYLVSLISLFIIVFGTITLINMVLRTWVFTKADMAYIAKIDPENCTKPLQQPEPLGSSDIKTPPQMRSCTKEEITSMEQEQKDQQIAEKQRQASDAVAMILVGLPVFYFHWRLARKEQ